MMEQLGWDAAVRALRRSSARVSYVMHSAVFALDQPTAWAEQGDSFRRTLAAAVELRAGQVCMTSGPAGALGWEQAAGRLAEAIAPLLDEARRLGVDVVMEPTGQLRQDIGFVHSLRDAVALARHAGLGVCVDTYWCFRERGLTETMHDGRDLIRLVQISDNPPGKAGHGDRMVPGDGIADLARLVRALRDLGYRGYIDLEILGPRIEAEGPAAAVDRGLRYVAVLLDDADATRGTQQ
ncbi:sugar phosphate isomerase/epimerase family protein [Phytohabitans suffuscus]|nr:sugar phosphate isomerase/epimerase family protein [Phytohabitans suffuscus]